MFKISAKEESAHWQLIDLAVQGRRTAERKLRGEEYEILAETALKF